MFLRGADTPMHTVLFYILLKIKFYITPVKGIPSRFGPAVYKKTLYDPFSFYGWGSTASRLEPLRGGSLLFTIKFPEIAGTHFIDLGRMKS